MSSHSRGRRASLAVAAALVATAVSASGASAHTVLSGESFFSIAAANGISPYTLASANGLTIGSTIVPGQTLYVPAAPAAPAYAPTTATASTAAAVPGMVPVSGPAGTAYLPSGAAQNLAALRQQSQAKLGVDIYPAGPLSGYRTYAQQAELYRLYLEGRGPLAAPPGTSAHEYGRALDVGSLSGAQAVGELGAPYGWQKLEAPTEWWHVSYTGG